MKWLFAHNTPLCLQVNNLLNAKPIANFELVNM